MDKRWAVHYLNEFINEMEHTIVEEEKKNLNRGYAKHVFWKNRDTLTEIMQWIEESEIPPSNESI